MPVHCSFFDQIILKLNYSRLSTLCCLFLDCALQKQLEINVSLSLYISFVAVGNNLWQLWLVLA